MTHPLPWSLLRGRAREGANGVSHLLGLSARLTADNAG